MTGSCLLTEITIRPMHPDLYLRFNSYHPLEHKVGVISIMQLKANTIPTDTVAKEAEEDDIKEALS